MANRYEVPRGDIHIRVIQAIGKYTDATIALCNLLEIERKTAYSRLHGKTQFKQNEIMAICDKYYVNAHWLLFGTGRMYR